MDFGHATRIGLRSKLTEIAAGPGATAAVDRFSVWTAARAVNTYFSVISLRDAPYVEVFASLQQLYTEFAVSGVDPESLLQASSEVGVSTTAPPHVQHSGFRIQEALTSLVVGCLCAAVAVALHRRFCHYRPGASYPELRSPYAAVSSSEQDALVSAVEDRDSLSDNDGEGLGAGLRSRGTSLLGSLLFLGSTIKERLAAGTSSAVGPDFAFGVGEALYDDGANPRCGPHTSEETKGLLHHEEALDEPSYFPSSSRSASSHSLGGSRQRPSPTKSPKTMGGAVSSSAGKSAWSGAGDASKIDDCSDEDDEDAMAALLKLRPAAVDSVGDEDDEEMSSRPLIGTERQKSLSERNRLGLS